jgi:amino acid transporter
MAVIEDQGTYVRPRRNLKLWGAIGLSLGIVGPTLAMSGNGQGIITSVHKSLPLIFLIGAIGIGIVAHGFIRLTQRYNHAGSAYALVGVTVGPRAGFFSGFSIVGTYIMFSVCCVAAVASFLDAFASSVANRPFNIPWMLTTVVCIALSGALVVLDLRVVTRVLLVIEGVGILCMLILAFTILGKGGAPNTGIDASTFSLHGISFSTLMAGVVAAFLSWAGFEGCAALGEETDDPKRNIPRALLWSIALTGVLFVLMMFVQTIGFGTSAPGQAAFASSNDSLATLGQTYIGRGFSLIISFAALMSAFACHLSSTATSGRLLFAYSRDGFGPREFARLRGPYQAPVGAMAVVLLAAFVINTVSWATGHPGDGTPIQAYFYFAVIGTIMLMIAYLMMEIAAIKHLLGFRPAEVVIPVLGIVLMVAVFYYNVKGQTSWNAPPYIAFIWAFIGLLIAVLSPGLASRVGARLAAELDTPAGKEMPMQLGTPDGTSRLTT